MSTPRQLKLGAMVHGVGHGWGEWRHPDAQADASTNFQWYKGQARLAEDAKFDFVFIADSLHIHEKSSPHYLNRFEPLTILSALAATTSKIGLVATVTVSYTEPFQVARQFSSLDHISGGRAGWNIVTSWLSGTAENFSKREHPPHAVRYRIAKEHVSTVKGLWDSWEDDAFTRNKQTGEFFDRDKLHSLNHQGEFFQVKGPLNIARSRQGQPVLFQAGSSGRGQKFAMKHADVVFSIQPQADAMAKFMNKLRETSAAEGRAEPPKVMFGLQCVLGGTEEEALRRQKEMIERVPIDAALSRMSGTLGLDFSTMPLDSRLADNSTQASKGMLAALANSTGDGNATVRDVAIKFGASTGMPQIVGTPEQVADRMEALWRSGGCAGFNLTPTTNLKSVEDFVEEVVPRLQAKGIYRTDYEGTTFRENLGLPVL